MMRAKAKVLRKALSALALLAIMAAPLISGQLAYADEPETEGGDASGITLTLHFSSIDGDDLVDPVAIEIAPGTSFADAVATLDPEEYGFEAGYTIKYNDPLFKKDGYADTGYRTPQPLSNYSSWSDVYYDRYYGNLVFDEDANFYYIMKKTIDEAEVTVTPPVCGEKIGTSDKPSATVANGVHYSVARTYWLEDDQASLFDGTVKGGDKIWAEIDFEPAMGYGFADDVSATINGGAAEWYSGSYAAVATVTAEHDWDAGTVTTEPTCTEAGVKTFACTVCKATKTETIPATGYAPGEDPTQEGTDGTAVGSGASAACADKAITSMTNDNDPAGSVYSKLQLKSSKQTKSSVTLAWTKVSGAAKYVIYGNKCGKTNKMQKLATVSGKSKAFSKILGKKVAKGTYYKFIVVALDTNNNVVSTSKVLHVATKGNAKKSNPTGVTVKAKLNKNGKALKKYTATSAIKINKGKTTTLKSAAKLAKGTKAQTHRKIAYESSNTEIATVTKTGKVKAVKKGTCYIYAYAQNGIAAKLKATVK